MNSWGGTGSDVGKFRFGGGSGNTAAAGGGLAVSGDAVYVADTGNDRIQRFTLDGGHGAVIVPPGQLANPRGIAVRRTRLFVADDQHHRLVVFDTGGHLLRAVGQNGSGPGGVSGRREGMAERRLAIEAGTNDRLEDGDRLAGIPQLFRYQSQPPPGHHVG